MRRASKIPAALRAHRMIKAMISDRRHGVLDKNDCQRALEQEATHRRQRGTRTSPVATPATETEPDPA